MKKSFLLLFFVFEFVCFLITQTLRAETNPTSSNKSQQLINQIFSEQTFTVTKEGDGLIAGTLRTVLMQALGIRQNNPFTLVTINFDPSIKRIRISKGNLPPIDKGLITIDCGGKITLDGSQINPAELEPNEKIIGITFRSSGNILKGCRFVGFKGAAVVLSGNRNQIRGNSFGDSSKSTTQTIGNSNDDFLNNGTAILILDESSENLIEANEFIHSKQESIVFNSQNGSGNRIAANSFINNGQKEIQSNQNSNQTPKLTLRSIVKEGDGYLISGTLNEPSEIELFMTYSINKENKMTTIVPLVPFGKGDFSLNIKNKGFTPGTTKIFALSTATGRNTSEFSDPVLIPIDPPKTVLPPDPTKEIVKNDLKETGSLQPQNQNQENEEKKISASNYAKPINERAGSALSADPSQSPSGVSAPSITTNDLPPASAYQPPIPSFVKPRETTVNLSSNPKRSGVSDTLKTDPPFEPANPP